MKSPQQIRSDVRTLAHRIDQVREALLRRADIEGAQVGKKCKRTSDALSRLLEDHKLPGNHKMALVGRFKSGRSSSTDRRGRGAWDQCEPPSRKLFEIRSGCKWARSLSSVWADATMVNHSREKRCPAKATRTDNQ